MRIDTAAGQRNRWRGKVLRPLHGVLLLFCLLVLTYQIGMAEEYPESDHPYASNTDTTWTYSYGEEASALKITFSDDTELESNCDFLYVIGEDETEQRFTGTSLQGASVYVLGDSFTLRLTSDSSVNSNGFVVTNVEAVAREEYEEYIATPRFTISSNGVITAYSGLVADLVIPSEINGVAVTAIYGSVFRGNTALVSVVIPDGVTSIGSSAFRDCSSLTSVTIGENVTSIGDYAFCGCSSMTSIDIPEGVTSIRDSAFYGCSSMTSIDIPDSVTSIGYSAFRDCSNLTSVTIGENVASIGLYVFYGCGDLASVDFPDKITQISYAAFYNCSNLVTVDLPDELTTIAGFAFSGCSSLSSVELPEGVTSIGAYAFQGCRSIVSIVLPDGITDIENTAFNGCYNATAYCNAGSYSAYATSNASIEFVDPTCPDLKFFQHADEDGTYYLSAVGCLDLDGIETISIPSEINDIPILLIGDYAYQRCENLKNVTIGDGVTSIGNSAFYVCSGLTSVTIGENVTSIGDYAFYGCSGLTSIDIPDSVTSIGYSAFYGCSGLTSVTIGENVTSIGDYAFYGCSGLTRVELPDSIESLGISCLPSGLVLIFGSNDVIEAYALQYGYQYISDGQNVVSDSITDPDEKVDWVVATYTDATMAEYEIALRLYDWVCANVRYDYQYYNDGKCDGEYSSDLGVGGEAALIDGWAVCHGYAEAYQWLLEEAGIEAKYVRGYDHAWNIAKIDGKWYQFDATWDEGGDGGEHDYFALSDMAIHSETKNHSSQYTYRHLVCDSWEANYYFKNGYLDAALTSLRSAINEYIAAGTYCGTLTLNYSDYPDGLYSEYTIALILNNDSDWDIAGRVVITPIGKTSYDFTFYPDDELVTDIIVEGIDTSDSEEYYYMYLGYVAQMNVSTLPQGNDITYASSDESVVTVSEDGLVTAIAEGTANIILTSDNYSRAFSIYVTDSSWLLDTYSCNLDVGENAQAELDRWYTWFLTDSAAVWSSADESIATVSQSGLISGVGYGSTTITLTTAAGVTDNVTVYVRKPVTAIVFDQEVYESYTGLDICPTLHAEGCDQDAYRYNYGRFTYTVSDEAIAAPDGYYSPVWVEDGAYWQYRPSVECFAPGEITLTATARDGSGVSASCTIIVKETPKLESIAFVPDAYEATEGQKLDLILRTESDDPDFYKENYGSFTYTSSDDAIATYYSSYSPTWNEELGCWEYTVRVNCLAPGDVTFTATARDGSGLVSACQIIVHSKIPFKLPSAVQIIESDAFLSIAADEVVLPEGVVSIGSRAFADSDSLKLINLPESLTSIAADAFEGCENVVLICKKGSIGQQFAEESGIPYVIQ